MWTRLLEWCADSLGALDGAPGSPPALRRRKQLTFYGVVLLLAVAGVVLRTRFGVRGLIPCAAMFWVGVAAARSVLRERAQLWCAARLALTHRGQHPSRRPDSRLAPPTARVLHELAVVVDAARRGRYVQAIDRLPYVERDLLRPDELRLLEAARALLSLGLGEAGRAAQQAVAALPTGSEELDAQLGRVVLADAWNEPARLDAIERAWTAAVVAPGAADGAAPGVMLTRLGRLARLRIDPEALQAVPPLEARALADEARVVGADSLAADLEARGRASLYR